MRYVEVEKGDNITKDDFLRKMIGDSYARTVFEWDLI